MDAAVRELTYAQAIQEAMAIAMEADENVVLMGEDIGVYGGAFQVTGDLVHRFGEDRVMDTPISELGGAGVAVGAAMTGLKPIFEFQFSDFATLAMEQIVNQAAKMRYMLGGEVSVPLVMRFPSGSRHGRRGPAQPEPRSLAGPRAGPQGRAALHAPRRQGPAARGDRRPRPRDDLRAQAALQDQGPGAGGPLHRADRHGRGAPARAST